VSLRPSASKLKSKSAGIIRDVPGANNYFMALDFAISKQSYTDTTEILTTSATVIVKGEHVLLDYSHLDPHTNKTDIDEIRYFFESTVSKDDTITLSNGEYLNEATGDKTIYDISGTITFKKFDVNNMIIYAEKVSMDNPSSTYYIYDHKFFLSPLTWTTSSSVDTTTVDSVNQIINIFPPSSNNSFRNSFGSIFAGDIIELKIDNKVYKFTIESYDSRETGTIGEILNVKESIPTEILNTNFVGTKIWSRLRRRTTSSPKATDPSKTIKSRPRLMPGVASAGLGLPGVAGAGLIDAVGGMFTSQGIGGCCCSGLCLNGSETDCAECGGTWCPKKCDDQPGGGINSKCEGSYNDPDQEDWFCWKAEKDATQAATRPIVPIQRNAAQRNAARQEVEDTTEAMMRTSGSNRRQQTSNTNISAIATAKRKHMISGSPTIYVKIELDKGGNEVYTFKHTGSPKGKQSDTLTLETNKTYKFIQSHRSNGVAGFTNRDHPLSIGSCVGGQNTNQRNMSDDCEMKHLITRSGRNPGLGGSYFYFGPVPFSKSLHAFHAGHGGMDAQIIVTSSSASTRASTPPLRSFGPPPVGAGLSDEEGVPVDDTQAATRPIVPIQRTATRTQNQMRDPNRSINPVKTQNQMRDQSPRGTY